MSAINLILARVLVAIPHLGVDTMHVVQGTVEHVEALAKAGLVDMEKAAVAYAKSHGAEIVTIGAEAIEAAMAAGPTEDLEAAAKAAAVAAAEALAAEEARKLAGGAA